MIQLKYPLAERDNNSTLLLSSKQEQGLVDLIIIFLFSEEGVWFG